MLKVQEFLETHSFKDLEEMHGVFCGFSKSGHKWSLNYGMLEAKDNDLLAQQCRGLILSCEDGRSLTPIEVNGKLSYGHIVPGKTRVLCYGMDRFFNYGQEAAAKVDLSDPRTAILEKLDGTCILCYFDLFARSWCIATRSVPEADVLLDNGLFTFRTLFEKALFDTNGMTFNEFTDHLDKEITYVFELTSPYNRVVVDYKESRITLIAARSVIYGTELVIGGKDWESFNELDINTLNIGIPCVQAHACTDMNSLLEWVSSKNPLEHEGVVVRDVNFNRVKVKNASYVAFHRARDVLGTSERNCLELVLAGNDDDVLAALPEEIVQRILNYKNQLKNMIRDYDRTYQVVKYASDKILVGDKKTFALMVNELKDTWTAPLFQMYSGKCENMKDFIQKSRKEGTWGDNFLDKILNIISHY